MSWASLRISYYSWSAIDEPGNSGEAETELSPTPQGLRRGRTPDVRYLTAVEARRSFRRRPRLSLRGLGTGRPRRRALKARKIGTAAPPCEVVWLWHAIGQSPRIGSAAPSAPPTRYAGAFQRANTRFLVQKRLGFAKAKAPTRRFGK